MELIRSDNL